MSFMPLASADPFGGVIITDWYSPPESPGERFKMTIYILERQLRADGIKVAVFRQTRNGGSDWQDAATKQETATELENAILTRRGASNQRDRTIAAIVLSTTGARVGLLWGRTAATCAKARLSHDQCCQAPPRRASKSSQSRVNAS